jgi:hypothetical protein
MRIQRLTFFQRLLVNLTLPTSPSPERRNQPLRELGPAQNTPGLPLPVELKHVPIHRTPRVRFKPSTS